MLKESSEDTEVKYEKSSPQGLWDRKGEEIEGLGAPLALYVPHQGKQEPGHRMGNVTGPVRARLGIKPQVSGF